MFSVRPSRSAWKYKVCVSRNAVRNGTQRAATNVKAAAVEDTVAAVVDEEESKEQPDFEDAYEIETLSISQVQELVRTVSEETDVAEVHVKLADLEVRFRRSSAGLMAAAPAPAPVAQAPAPAPAPALESEDFTVEDSIDFSVVPVSSSKVGVFKRCLFIGGKQAGKKPIVSAGSEVKNKQTIAFIEQLGTFSPIEAPMDGEIVGIKAEDGDPVEFDQMLFEMVPRMASSGSRIK